MFFINDNNPLKSYVGAIAYWAALVFNAELAVAQEKESAAAPSAAGSSASMSAVAASSAAKSEDVHDDILVVGKKPQTDVEKAKNWFQNYLPYEQRVAGWVDNTARSIDRFFGSDDAFRVDNDSYLRVTNDLRWEEDKGVSNDLRPRLKLDLPTASKRLHLLVESDTPEQRTAEQEAVPGLRNSVDNRRTTVFGLGADLDSWMPEWKKQIQGGLRVALPLDPYVRFIARRDMPLRGEWELNSYNRLAWFNSDGYSANSEIKIGEPLSPHWRLYYETDLTWQEKRDYLQFAQSANLVHLLSTSSALTYTLGFSGTGFEEPHIDKYFLTADYRRNLARRIVFLDVIPELSLPEEYGFDPHWAITVRLELYFQKKIED